jgi:tetratricopeptide (TPR) repeat protein
LLLHPMRGPITLSPPQPQVRPEELAGRQEALEWFQAERQVLLAVISQAASSGFSTHAWQLPWAAAAFFAGQGYWQELETTQQSALAAARHLGDLAGQTQAHHHLGKAQGFRGAFAEADAHLSAALELSGQLGSGILQARVHLGLAWIVGLHSRDRDGLSHSEQALCLFRAAGYRAGEADALNAAGWAHAQLGGYLEALEYCGHALALHRELRDRPGEAVTWTASATPTTTWAIVSRQSRVISRPSMPMARLATCATGPSASPISATPTRPPETTTPPAAPGSTPWPSSITCTTPTPARSATS